MGDPWNGFLVLVCLILVLFDPMLLTWYSFVVIKIIMGVRLLSYATSRRPGMQDRQDEDVINDFGRDPVGEGKEERVCLLRNLFLIFYSLIAS